ncbi:MAG: 4Fe-4S binding protein [Bacteroidota bacterium]|nr:4Fe-4S binding protein [Bacteroidota bacterium]
MVKRKIIKIDESLCDGCALCIPSCPEGALQIVNGKAKLVKESFCDGLGACLGDCPQNALTVVEEFTEEYDNVSVNEHIKLNAPDKLQTHIDHMAQHGHELSFSKMNMLGGGCPSARTIQWAQPQAQAQEQEQKVNFASQLRQWPVQLHLVPPTAPYFQNADFVLVADCVPFAYPNFHSEFLSGNAIAIACPKLDDTTPYVQKLAQIFKTANLKSVKVVMMEVPCCSGLVRLVQEAANYSGLVLPIEIVTIGIKGNLLGSKILQH